MRRLHPHGELRAVVRLSDGLIEMKDRSELSLAASRSETTIRLARGSIIVQAAKQHGRTPTSRPTTAA
jgi:ferric-dicitrate binding protein FerR (iron transport regulator)